MQASARAVRHKSAHEGTRTRIATEIMQLTSVVGWRRRRSSGSRCKPWRILHLNINSNTSTLLISRLALYIALACLTYTSNTGYCLQASTNSSLSTATATNKSTPAIVASAASNNDTTLGNVNDTSTSAELLLLSGEDFVDSREVPSILFDGTTNNDDPATTTLRPDSERHNSSNNGTDATTSQSISRTNSSQILSPSASYSSPPSPSSSLESVNNLNDAPPMPTKVSTPSAVPTSTAANNQPATIIDEVEEDANEDEDQETTSNGSASEKPFEPPQNISQYMDYIEKLFHDLRHQVTDLFEPHLPQLIRTSQMVDLSSSCSYDMLRMALALRQFEPWALRMIDSSGKVPEGIFEGTFTALGSYDECLNTVFKQSSSHSQSSQPTTAQAGGHSLTSTPPSSNGHESEIGGKQEKPTQGQYCLVTVSPFMPPKPPADKVDRLFQEEANRRNYTRFSRLSPMFYYMKFRIGVCIPSSCHQRDMGSIAGALSSSLRLNISIPDCRVRRPEGEPLTSHQLAGGLIFGLVCASVLAATLLDCFKLKWTQIRSQERELFAAGGGGQSQKLQIIATTAVASHPGGGVGGAQQQREFMIGMAHTLNEQQQQQQQLEESNKTFGKRLTKHWSWMSFSFLANFRLYFRPRTAAHEELAGSRKKVHNNQVISCLDGIRVLSLCWVIVANSYLTLDPRATKRLTKTREAPRDFLFQVVVQASLAIETFFFLSGLLMSLSFARQLEPTTAGDCDHEKTTSTTRKTTNHLHLLKWVRFYVHRYVRMTPPTMLVIAFSMYAYHYGDGPLWFEATQRAHQSCTQNWWRHLLHVANFIDTRQMCFIHYWYIAADMQLFLFAPVLLLILYKSRPIGLLLCALIGSLSIGSVFYTTYARNLPPTLLFYSTDPESRREFGNTVMTKPFAHALPYLVGMLVGWCFVTTSGGGARGENKSEESPAAQPVDEQRATSAVNKQRDHQAAASCATSASAQSLCSLTPWRTGGNLSSFSLTGLFGTLALVIALIELFLPYKWNNSHLPSRLCSALYAALFRFGWSLVLAFIVISCRHRRSRHCCSSPSSSTPLLTADTVAESNLSWCFCGSGGNQLNRLLGLHVFSHLSKLSFVAYLVHLPLMSVFIGQTRGLFAFSHTLVIHFAISYLVMSFALAFVLAHVIEFPFVTFERLLFDKLHQCIIAKNQGPPPPRQPPTAAAAAAAVATTTTAGNGEKFYHANHRQATMLRLDMNNKSGDQHLAVTSYSNQIHRITTGANNNQVNQGENLATYKL